MNEKTISLSETTTNGRLMGNGSPSGWLPALGEMPKGLQGRIEFPGVVSDEELCRLYQEATFSIYPSLYEGFGLPVLDSLWHGCPVASSFHSSLMEFTTPGVFFFDPCDASTLDEACASLLSARHALPINRADLAHRFSWRSMARAAASASVACPVLAPSSLMVAMM